MSGRPQPAPVLERSAATPTLVVQRAGSARQGPSNARLRRWLATAARLCPGGAGELTLRIVGEAEMSALNRTYRGRAGPTNVLSFPLDLPVFVDDGGLGDIVICAPVVRREARAQGKTLEAHWAHMLVHGYLHLLGHDHQDRAEAERMEALERRILGQIGFADPYSEPTPIDPPHVDPR